MMTKTEKATFSAVLEPIRKSAGRVFSVTFTKKDGTTREMNARLGVKSYLKGGELGYDANSKGLLIVFDMAKTAYRAVNLLKTSKVVVDGVTFTF